MKLILKICFFLLSSIYSKFIVFYAVNKGVTDTYFNIPFKVGSVLGEQCATSCDDTNAECSELGEIMKCSCKMEYYDNGGICHQSRFSFTRFRLLHTGTKM